LDFYFYVLSYIVKSYYQDDVFYVETKSLIAEDKIEKDLSTESSLAEVVEESEGMESDAGSLTSEYQSENALLEVDLFSEWVGMDMKVSEHPGRAFDI